MAKRSNTELPTAPLGDLARWWKSEGVRGIIIGGLAVSLLAKPRMTSDVDALVILDDGRWDAFCESADTFGLVSRIPDAITYARESRTLLLCHEASGIDVDLAFGNLPFEQEMVQRAMLRTVQGIKVHLATPEDLAILKAIAGRERDWADFQGLVQSHPNWDQGRIRTWIRIFAEALERSDLIDEVERRLA